MPYAGQLAVRRKESILATEVLYLAVVQNSKKWKVESAPMKKGSRQRGDAVKDKIEIITAADSARATPRQKDRIAMPSRDFGWPGR